MGDPLPIGFADLDRYADRFGLRNPDDFETLVIQVTALDDLWFALRREAGKASNADAKSASL